MCQVGLNTNLCRSRTSTENFHRKLYKKKRSESYLRAPISSVTIPCQISSKSFFNTAYVTRPPGGPKLVPICEGIETSKKLISQTSLLSPKLVPICEGIETSFCFCAKSDFQRPKLVPICEGIETSTLSTTVSFPDVRS